MTYTDTALFKACILRPLLISSFRGGGGAVLTLGTVNELYRSDARKISYTSTVDLNYSIYLVDHKMYSNLKSF